MEEALKQIHKTLESIYQNKKFTALPVDDMPSQLQPIAETVNSLGAAVREVTTCILHLSNGILNIELPPRANMLAGSVKQLHSHLTHLTWQTQQIANGDYNQSVDYMGEFAAAFNTMIRQLKEREAHLNADNVIMSTVFDHIESLLIVDAANRHSAFIVNACARETFHIAVDTLDLRDAAQRHPFLKQLLFMEIDDHQQFDLFDSQTQKWYYVIYSQFVWLNNGALLIYCMNITEQKRRETLLKQDALTDALTGIANRRALDVDIHSAWIRYRQLGVPISMIVIDIDHFKGYNDTYGHLQGDACLKAVAACVRGVVSRSSDLLARYGGEEFLAMLPNTTSEAAMFIAEKIRAAVEKTEIPLTEGEPVMTRVTVSLGVAARIPSMHDSPMELVREADQAMYRAKHTGRNRVVLAEKTK